MAGPSSHAEYGIIADLLETIEQDPYALNARKLLADQYVAFNWNEAAADTMKEILEIQPDDTEATVWLRNHYRPSRTKTVVKPKDTRVVRAAAMRDESPYAKPGDFLKLENGYRTLMHDAEALAQDLQIYQELCPGIDISGHIADIKALADGRSAAVLKIKKPDTARAIAAKIKDTDLSSAQTEIAYVDLEANARYWRSQDGYHGDKVRDAVLKRAQAIKVALPGPLAHICETAFMHIEHEVLGKKYQNEEGLTMLGDPIASIPRSNFWSTEDGYAWDMSELAQALQANKGVMRNPLSSQMFSADDVKAIVQHPEGKCLAALQLKQSQLSNGVRTTTIEALDRMAKVMLEDQSDDAAKSREAVDDFLAYAATLPGEEQATLNELRVPATDSHTGRQYDGSIGEAVADAKANRQCFHKTGDYLQQATRYLRSKSAGKGKMSIFG